MVRQLFKSYRRKKKDYLSELDTPIGDGDHGNNMARGMAEYKIAFDKKYHNNNHGDI